MVVGSTTVEPGKSTTVSLSFTMPESMGGPHHFVVDLKTNDPVEPTKQLSVKADFVAQP